MLHESSLCAVLFPSIDVSCTIDTNNQISVHNGMLPSTDPVINHLIINQQQLDQNSLLEELDLLVAPPFNSLRTQSCFTLLNFNDRSLFPKLVNLQT